MTNREAAIEWFSMLKKKFVKTEYEGYLDLAISALEKQEQTENEWCPDCAEYDKERHCCHRFTKVIRQTVEECKREWANEGWIPVTERLPEEDDYRPCYGYDDGAVWWLNDVGMMGLGWYYTSTENWAFYDEITHVEGIVGNVIAWRPLPEAYTEEEFEEDRNER